MIRWRCPEDFEFITAEDEREGEALVRQHFEEVAHPRGTKLLGFTPGPAIIPPDERSQG